MTSDRRPEPVISVRLLSRTLVAPVDDEQPARFVLDLEVCGETLRVAASGQGEWAPADAPHDSATWNAMRRRFGPDLERVMDGKLRRWVGATPSRDD